MNESAVEIAGRFWQLMATNDFRSVGSVLADDFVLDWPQSGERIRGRDNFAAMNEEYPAHGPWTFTINRLLGDETDAVSEVTVSDGVQLARAISFFAVSNCRIVKMVEFWPDPFPPRADRKHLVERATEQRGI